MLDVAGQFIFTGVIRHQTETGLLIAPLGSRDPLWLQRRLTQILDHDRFAIPKWLARQKFPEEMLAQGEVRVSERKQNRQAPGSPPTGSPILSSSVPITTKHPEECSMSKHPNQRRGLNA
jgi:hypothetical protein